MKDGASTSISNQHLKWSPHVDDIIKISLLPNTGMNEEDEFNAIKKIANTDMEHRVLLEAIRKIANRRMNEHDQFTAIKETARIHSDILFIDIYSIKKICCYDFKVFPDAIVDYYRFSLQKWYNRGFKSVVGYNIEVIKRLGESDYLRLTKKDQ